MRKRLGPNFGPNHLALSRGALNEPGMHWLFTLLLVRPDEVIQQAERCELNGRFSWGRNGRFGAT